MKKYIPLNVLAFLLIATSLFSQNNYSGGNIPQPFTYTENGLKHYGNVVYGHAKDWKDYDVTLSMDIVCPRFLANDSIKKHPVILLLHGGGFVHSYKENLRKEIELIARQGFVAVSIDYREGLNQYPDKWDSTLYLALYRAVQDTKAALRFLACNASEYTIDTSSIFIGGASSGALTALYSEYYIQANWENKFPWIGKYLGNTDSSTNTLKSAYSVKGIIDMWGGIGDTSSISASDARRLPILIFHGTADTIVPYTSADGHYRKMVPVQGGYLIAQRYKHLQGCYQLTTIAKGEHVSGLKTNYLIQQITRFCENVIQGDCTAGEITLPFEP